MRFIMGNQSAFTTLTYLALFINKLQHHAVQWFTIQCHDICGIRIKENFPTTVMAWLIAPSSDSSPQTVENGEISVSTSKEFTIPWIVPELVAYQQLHSKCKPIHSLFGCCNVIRHDADHKCTSKLLESTCQWGKHTECYHQPPAPTLR